MSSIKTPVTSGKDGYLAVKSFQFEGKDFLYYPETGALFKKCGTSYLLNDRKDKDGYIVVYIGRKRFSAARMILSVLMDKDYNEYKEWTALFMDYNPSNLVYSNLRATTHRNKNFHKRKPYGKYTSNHKGVSRQRMKYKGVYISFLNDVYGKSRVNCDSKYYGSFENETDAAIFYNLVVEEIAGEFACLNNV